ncbi:hypothetical protein EXIGLDRAFT_729286 [Exidia glandulosa HHB12029]|uniref:Uncharacterized protein n=1 Tax=Exidia glandulosa HHB12029 TaxID=1314781 RepID=A0A165B4I9_EXIGL|nr:hypothetical protein EXIGLDRAFT_734281 [Exidia glandulosa HHB12029]KZV82816.1 hypothetical protein EXIGLDRAFT_729286 [Exidia glandulosa HHB12029]
MKQCFQYTEGLVRRLTLEDGSALLKIPRFVLSNVESEHLGAECWSWIYSRVSSVYLDDELLWHQADSVA